jgi:sirohydrochlorin cobaltochelatase
MNGLILFGHGARDPRWADPMRRLRERIAARAPQMPVELAFLEIMEPDLASAAATLTARGCTGVTIVPIFLGQGPHVRDDLAARVQRLRGAHPALEIRCVPPVGEDDGVLDALAGYALAAVPVENRRPRPT